jgi:hypothetical protein
MLLKKSVLSLVVHGCLSVCGIPSLAFSESLSKLQNASANDPFQCAISQSTPQSVSDCNRSEISKIGNENLNTGSYSFARERMFQFIDVYLNTNNVRVVKSVYTPDEYPVGDFGIPQNGVNCEHTYPQSFLKKSSRYPEARADLFHLFPVNERENTRRSNLPYAECGNENPAYGKRCAAGYEPPPNHKGIVARAMFYIATTYSLPIDDEQEKVLRKWNEEYPVDQNEEERTSRITEVQGNHNPFVTHPEWVNLILDF